MPVAEKRERLDSFLTSRSSSGRSARKRQWWSRCDAVEKESALQALRTGYAEKNTTENQRVVGRKRDAAYEARPEKHTRARADVLLRVDQCRFYGSDRSF